MTPIKGLENHLSGENAAPRAAPPHVKAPPLISSNPVAAAGYYLLLGYMFLAFSRVLDVLLPGARIPVFFCVGMFVETLLS
jgi:hypothetical protein